MKPIDIILIIVLAIVIGLALKTIIKRKGTCGCGKDDCSCSFCNGDCKNCKR